MLALMKLLLIFQIYLVSLYKEMTFTICKMGPSSVSCKWNTQGKCPGVFVQDENTWICSASDRIRNIWSRNCSISSKTKLSKIEDDGEETHRSNDQNGQLQSQDWKNRDRGISQKVKRGKTSALKIRMGECCQWQANGQWSRGESCSFSHGNNRGQPAQSSSLAPWSQTPNDARRPYERKSTKRQCSFQEEKIKDRARITQKKGIVRIRRVIIGLPYVKITDQNRDANSAKSTYSGTLRLTVSPVSRRKVVEKDR